MKSISNACNAGVAQAQGDEDDGAPREDDRPGERLGDGAGAGGRQAARDAAGGAGPDDDPLLRSLRGESREEGRAAGLEEGLKQGHAAGREEGWEQGHATGLTEGIEKGHAAGTAENRAKMVRRILRSRGIEVSAGFPADAPGFADSPDDEAVDAALACDGERDFHARLRKP